MIDLLFIEIGAVVTELLGPGRCTIEPFCHPAQPPTFQRDRRVEVDFAESLGARLDGGGGGLAKVAIATARALYDQFDGDSAPIGPSWPGGGYEGVLGVRDTLVQHSKLLAAAVASLPGQPWEHRFIASIDEATGEIRRYHGFHAEVMREDAGGLVLRVAHAGGSAMTGWAASAREVRYAPGDKRFYTGALVADQLARTGRGGALYMTSDAASTFGTSLPKLPPGAGL